MNQVNISVETSGINELSIIPFIELQELYTTTRNL